MHKDLVIKLLGLKSDASDEDIANAANSFQADMLTWKNEVEADNEKLKNAVAEAEAKVKVAEDAATKIANEAKGMAEELVNRDLEVYKDVIIEPEKIKEQLLNNRAGTVAILQNIKTAAKTTTTTTRAKEPIHNSKTAPTPQPVVPENGTQISEEVAKKISNRAREIGATMKLPHQTAFMMAKGEVMANIRS